jgi:hypothetical protein
MGGKAPETCWATHKLQVINLWNCCILLVDLFESYNDARTCGKSKLCNYIRTLYRCYLLSGKCSESFCTIFTVHLDRIHSAAGVGINVFLYKLHIAVHFPPQEENSPCPVQAPNDECHSDFEELTYKILGSYIRHICCYINLCASAMQLLNVEN